MLSTLFQHAGRTALNTRGNKRRTLVIGLRPRTSSVLAEHELDVCPDWVAVKKKKGSCFSAHDCFITKKNPFLFASGLK